ncbi:MAG TPA: ComEC/Rec2 family competence protein, partial [Steroidobacteraceae bacterium]|nr:ComEC/Rec2 family competence protein [Steroidobacteraceae bacterium]
MLLLLLLPALPPTWVAIPVLAAAVLGWALRRRLGLGMVLCGFGFGFIVAGAYAHQYFTQRWPVARADERVIARVIVDSIPVAFDDGWSFDGVVSIESPAEAIEALRVRLISRDPNVRPHAGDRWRLLLELRPPRARVNPGATDVERVLFHDRVHALGNVVTGSINRRIDAGHRPLMALRERIAQHIDERVADRDAAALISALAVGATGAMSREQWCVFNATGTTHLVAISGLHVTLFAVIA